MFKVSPPFIYLNINHDDFYNNAVFELSNVIQIKDRMHARAFRKTLNFKNIITGDLIFTKLYWSSIPITTEYRRGIAIVRDEKVIFYSLPGTNPNSRRRIVLTEKKGKFEYAAFQHNK